MERIKAILKEYDIAGSVVLHTPGFSEYFLKINPSYSCAKQEGDGLRIVAKLSDFNGDKQARDKKLEDTVNMISHLADTNGATSLQMYNVMDELKKHLDIDSDKGNFSSHTTQNN